MFHNMLILLRIGILYCYGCITNMGMAQYLLIPFLGEWPSIYQLFWCSPGVQGFDTLPNYYGCITNMSYVTYCCGFTHGSNSVRRFLPPRGRGRGGRLGKGDDAGAVPWKLVQFREMAGDVYWGKISNMNNEYYINHECILYMHLNNACIN